VKKFFIVVFGFLCAVLIGAALFLPSIVTVERSIVVDRSPETVFPLVSDVRNWESWSPWYAKDKDMKLTYSEGPTDQVGSSYSWESESQGSGQLTITRSEPPREMAYDLDFGEQGTAKSFFILKPQGDGHTEVTWKMDADMGTNPIGKLMGLTMDRMVGPDFESGLANIKSVAERAATTENSNSEGESKS